MTLCERMDTEKAAQVGRSVDLMAF